MIPYPSGVNFNDLPDCSLHPTQFVKRYTVTGMTHKVRVKRTTSLGKLVLRVNGRDVLLWRWRDQVFASASQCPHQGASLQLADMEDLGLGLFITCPSHNWRFNMTSGETLAANQTCAKLPVYQTSVDADTGAITLLFDSIDQSCFTDDLDL